MIKSLLLALLLTSTAATASIVAVIDSGTDVEHEALVSNLWNNPVDSLDNNRDDDRNGFTDDFYGWNFVSNNNQVLDRDGISQFSEDVRKFFEFQYLMYLYNKGDNRFTAEWIEWYNNTLFVNGQLNPAIARPGEFYGQYAHGSHVAGIVAKDNYDAKIITAKLMGTKAALKFTLRSETAESADEKAGAILSEADMNNIKGQLSGMAVNQAERMMNIAKYIDGHGARVANASFGTGYHMTVGWLKQALAGVAIQSIEELALHFQKELVAQNKISLSKAPNTLFVVASGNDTTDIDAYPDSPASIISDNVISVAATWERKEIADFSCYGTKTVHVAAPGVGIESAAPGGHYVYMNGTSQATPYVAKVASMVVDANPSLTPKQVKEIIIGTVDVKPWLADKVMSSGIVNLDRAVEAADLMATADYTMEEAIDEANFFIDDVEQVNSAKSITNNPFVIDTPLKNFVSKRPSPISFE